MKYLIVVFFISFLNLSFANDKSIGVDGHLKCGRFLSYCDQNKLQLNCQTQTFFVMGYISGISWTNSIPTTKLERDSIKYSLINFCRNNPLKDTHDGAIHIFKQVI